MSTSYFPYTYRIFHRPTKTYYYGAKYSKKSDPATFWVDYFTSSKIVHSLIEQYGTHTFEIQRIKSFNTKEETLLWETKFLTKINAAARSDWLNMHNGDGKFFSCKGGKKKGSPASNKGIPLSKEQKEKISKTRKERGHGKASTKYLPKLHGDKNPMRNQEVLSKYKEQITGRKRQYREDGSWFWYKR
jgi:hypothetical protein